MFRFIMFMKANWENNQAFFFLNSIQAKAYGTHAITHCLSRGVTSTSSYRRPLFYSAKKKKREKKNQLDHVIWSSAKLNIANFKYKVLKIYSDHAVDFSIIFQIWY